MGSLLVLQGKEHTPTDAFGEGDIGAVAKLKDVMTGDLLLDSDRDVEMPSLDFPEPVMSFAITPKAKGDEEKVATSLRRLSEEDPTLNLRRDPRASLHVQGRDRYEYLVAEGAAQLVEGEGLAEALRHYYRKVRGEHPNWAEYDAAMVNEQRLLLSISVDRAYGPLR